MDENEIELSLHIVCVPVPVQPRPSRIHLLSHEISSQTQPFPSHLLCSKSGTKGNLEGCDPMQLFSQPFSSAFHQKTGSRERIQIVQRDDEKIGRIKLTPFRVLTNFNFRHQFSNVKHSSVPDKRLSFQNEIRTNFRN